MKGKVIIVGNFEKNPEELLNDVLCAWLEMFITTERYQILFYGRGLKCL